MKFKTLHTFDTIYSADSIEWCPAADYQEYFVCGTYQLCEGESEANPSDDNNENRKRKGRIYLFKYDLSENELKMVQQIETEAVLDQKWKHKSLLVATSIGEVHVYELENDQLVLKHKLNIGANNDEESIALSVDWNSSQSPSKIVVSDSLGGISLLHNDQDNLKIISNWRAHGFEAWITIFNKWNDCIVYTGGDDTFLNAYDTRCDDSIPQMQWKNKSHGAGVTTLLSFSKREHILATGSYDESLRLFDTRHVKNPLSEVNLSGGIWRIKPNPLDDSQLLCACMYHNFSVLQIHDGNSNLEIISEFNEHKSICYGSDWCHLSHNSEMFVATCSFYDHKMSLCSLADI